MASPQLSEREVTGWKYLERVQGLLGGLRPTSCERDAAGNRRLFLDQYCALLLLYFFNPAIDSLRGIQRATELAKVQRKLGTARVSRGALSEGGHVFDPKPLEQIVSQLSARQQTSAAVHPRLAHIPIAVDGTILKALPQITQACFPARRDQGWRLHTHLEVLRGIPKRIELTDGSNAGDANEKASLRRLLAPDHCYICDRGYEQFSLFNAIVRVGSSYIIRIRADHHFAPTDTRELSAEARAAGVTADQVGQLGSNKSQRIEHPDHPVRCVRVRIEEQPRRGQRGAGGRRAPSVVHELVLATNLLDVPAEIIALLYRWRWEVELFFRFFKHVLGSRHLLSEHPRGILLQVYCALIACLLIQTASGRKPNKATFELLCHYFSGWASDDELAAHLKHCVSPPT